MFTKNPSNEQIKHKYINYLEHAHGRSEATINQILSSIKKYEVYSGNSDFRSFDQKRAIAFKEYINCGSYAPSTVLTTINNVKSFYCWLALQPSYKSRVKANDIEYLNLSEKSIRAASAPKDRPFPTLNMIEAVLHAMPQNSLIDKRNRALIAFGTVTGIRVEAVTSLKCKHFDKVRMLVIQQPDEVKTKFSKRINTFLMPISELAESIFLEWIEELESSLLFGPTEPIFPKTKVSQDLSNQFTAAQLSREHWQSTQPIREIYKAAFSYAGLPPHSPHSFRKMIVSEMYKRNLSIPDFKAWSQNLGHEGALTTLTSYGQLSLEEQGHKVRKSKSDDIKGGSKIIADIEELLRKNR